MDTSGAWEHTRSSASGAATSKASAGLPHRLQTVQAATGRLPAITAEHSIMKHRANCSFCSWVGIGKDRHGKTNQWACTMCRATCERDQE